MWFFETSLFEAGYGRVAGIDEAGRGPLAGPVVAAAVSASNIVDIKGVNDSKKLSPCMRAGLAEKILNHVNLSAGIGIVSHSEIDELNILNASLLAFARAVENLKVKPDFCILDGNQKSGYISIPQKTIVKGDSKSFLIAAASIIAKETRDKIMTEFDMHWPVYGFRMHKGYPTRSHIKAIREHGPCPIHRMTFKPLNEKN